MKLCRKSRQSGFLTSQCTGPRAAIHQTTWRPQPLVSLTFTSGMPPTLHLTSLDLGTAHITLISSPGRHPGLGAPRAGSDFLSSQARAWLRAQRLGVVSPGDSHSFPFTTYVSLQLAPGLHPSLGSKRAHGQSCSQTPSNVHRPTGDPVCAAIRHGWALQEEGHKGTRVSPGISVNLGWGGLARDCLRGQKGWPSEAHFKGRD